MIGAIRSELTRLNRKSVVLGWLGLTALFAVMINAIMFRVASDGAVPAAGGPGVALPNVEALTASTGLTAGLGAASNLFGIIALSYWAVVSAVDYQSGLIRLLVAAQPRRRQLLGAKVIALVIGTAVATTVAVLVNVPSAAPSAEAAGIATDAWSQGAVGHVLSAWLNTFLAMLVWGVLGLTLAIVSRSSALAISVGVGYVLVVETLIKTAVTGAAEWLPGTALTALAQGGSSTLSYGGALGMGAGCVILALGIAAVVVTRRPITD